MNGRFRLKGRLSRREIREHQARLDAFTAGIAVGRQFAAMPANLEELTARIEESKLQYGDSE
jgi:hypothetical protein